MDLERTPLNRMARGMGVWVAVVLANLILCGIDTLLQMQIIGHDITGPLALVHYIFFLYSPFVLSGLCAILFAVFIPGPFRDLLLAMGYNRFLATGICVIVTVVGTVIAYWIVIESWVALSDCVARTK